MADKTTETPVAKCCDTTGYCQKCGKTVEAETK